MKMETTLSKAKIGPKNMEKPSKTKKVSDKMEIESDLHVEEQNSHSKKMHRKEAKLSSKSTVQDATIVSVEEPSVSSFCS